METEIPVLQVFMYATRWGLWNAELDQAMRVIHKTTWIFVVQAGIKPSGHLNTYCFCSATLPSREIIGKYRHFFGVFMLKTLIREAVTGRPVVVNAADMQMADVTPLPTHKMVNFLGENGMRIVRRGGGFHIGTTPVFDGLEAA